MSGISNADLMREIKTINKVTDDHELRIKATEHYITTQTAVAEYVAQLGAEAKAGSSKGSDESPLAKIIVTLFTLFAGIIALITYIIQNYAK
jgi:hypothetical protein